MAWPFGKQGASEEDQKKELDAFIEKIGLSVQAKVEEQLKPVREEVTAIKKKWDALETAAGGSGGETEEEQRARAEAEANMTDEQKRVLNERKLLALSIATNARITEGEILGEVVGQGLGEFVSKIKEYFANTPIERKGAADYSTYCRNIVDMIVGREARSGGLRFDGQNKKFFLEDAGGKSGEQGYEFLDGDMTWSDPRSGKVLTATQQLKALGITPEEFAKSIEKGVV